jgi:hypothetical protein
MVGRVDKPQDKKVSLRKTNVCQTEAGAGSGIVCALTAEVIGVIIAHEQHRANRIVVARQISMSPAP